jgi:PHD/YefM family antitoxin component YafN of YafNO toxin-antitoxin module
MAISYKQTVQMQIGGETLDVVEHENGQRFVMVPLEDYPGMRETAHLLSSRANADELRESIAWLNKQAGSMPFDTPEGADEQRGAQTAEDVMATNSAAVLAVGAAAAKFTASAVAALGAAGRGNITLLDPEGVRRKTMDIFEEQVKSVFPVPSPERKMQASIFGFDVDPTARVSSDFVTVTEKSKT